MGDGTQIGRVMSLPLVSRRQDIKAVWCLAAFTVRCGILKDEQQYASDNTRCSDTGHDKINQRASFAGLRLGDFFIGPALAGFLGRPGGRFRTSSRSLGEIMC